MKNILLTSNSVNDILTAARNSFWDHSQNIREAQVGDIVYIQASGRVDSLFKEIAIKARVSKIENSPVTAHLSWPSNTVEGSTKTYKMRLCLDEIERVVRREDVKTSQAGITYF